MPGYLPVGLRRASTSYPPSVFLLGVWHQTVTKPELREALDRRCIESPESTDELVAAAHDVEDYIDVRDGQVGLWPTKTYLVDL